MLLVDVPGINGLGKTNGCEAAGKKVVDGLKSIRTNESGKVVGKFDFKSLELDNSNLESVSETIYKTAFDSYSVAEKVIFVGGDHSISYSLTRAFFDFVQNSGSGKEPCLIIFDAHPDVMPVAKGAENSPTHEEWLRGLIDDGFPSENILLVGARNIYPEELKFLKEKNIRTIQANKLVENFEDICDSIMEFSNGKDLYVSIDIDVIDPAFAPGTGYPESGGLTSRQFIYLVQRMNKIKNLKAIDLVEINPSKDQGDMTIKLGSKILSELI